MKSGACTDSDKTGSEAGTMVIQAPFIIAPTHQASASAKKASASASGDQASAVEGEGPLPLVLAGPSGAGRITFDVHLIGNLVLSIDIIVSMMPMWFQSGKSTLIKRLMTQFSSNFGFSVR